MYKVTAPINPAHIKYGVKISSKMISHPNMQLYAFDIQFLYRFNPVKILFKY